MTTKYLLDKYMPFSFWDNLKSYILSTGVEIVDEPLKFLPGYTNISVCHKPHHKDLFVRQIEEELFMLHDLLHLLFPLKLSGGQEDYVNRQVLGEYFVFFITEYYVQHYLINNNILGEDYNNYILKDRGYYYKLKEVLFRTDFRIVDAIDLVAGGVYPELTEMFTQDRINSQDNYKLLSEEDCGKGLDINFGSTTKCHHRRYQRILRGYEKQYQIKLIDLPNDWI